MWIEILLVLSVLLYLLYYWLTSTKNYWYERNIPNTGFKILFGDDKVFMMQSESGHDWGMRLYDQFKGVPFFGMWTLLGKPILMIRNDFDLIKSIWVKDFDHFAITDQTSELQTSVWTSTREEKLVINHIQTATGDEWKDIRSTFSPIFTSGKLRIMTPLLQEVNKKMNVYVSKLAESDSIFDTKDITGRYSIDGLATCAFGLDSGCFDEKESEFARHARLVFSPENISIWKFILSIFIPNLVKQAAAKMGIIEMFSHPLLNKSSKFLLQVVEQSYNHRKQTNEKRNDLLDMMIEAIEGKLENEDKNVILDQYDEDAKIVGHKKKKNLTYDDIISTALIMLSAGYDTTGQTMSFILYELAVNPECQEALYNEIKDNSDEDDELSYETIQSLPYLDAIIQETLRKHPVAFMLERVCSKEYKLPGHDLIIPKGGVVRALNVGICNDPEIFPNPKEFKPERFLKENKGDRNPYSFMGFSVGPRNCLAMRFATFEMKMCISSLVSNFKFVPCDKTVLTVERDPKNLLGGPKDGLWIKCEKR